MAILMSCSGVSPLTPIALTTTPLDLSGRPPFIMTKPEVIAAARLLFTLVSKSPEERLKIAVVFAFPWASSIPATTGAPSILAVRIGHPPSSTIAMEHGHPCCAA